MLDEGDVPCILSQAPNTQKVKAGKGMRVPASALTPGPRAGPAQSVPESAAVAVVPLLAVAHTLVSALLIPHAERAQRGWVVFGVVHRHAAGAEELTHRWARGGPC